MKKITIILCSFILLLSLLACSDGTRGTSNTTDADIKVSGAMNDEDESAPVATSPTPTPPGTPVYHKTGTVLGENVPLRDAPNSESEIIARVSPNQGFIIVGEFGDWYYVLFEGAQDGFFTKEVVTITSTREVVGGWLDADEGRDAFPDIYRAYKQNKLSAEEKYNGNVYSITAKINGMATDGLANLSGGVTLTMEALVDGTIVFFYAEFEERQEEALKKIAIGDTVTFEGECWGGSFSDCTLMTAN